jgi:predicted phosphodiesterase
MRLCILADIHANLAALEAVLADARKRRPDRYICLGDVVGYGPNPAECLQALRDLDAEVVQGNHEAGLLGELSTERFNAFALLALQHNRAILSPADLDYIAGFRTRVEVEGKALFIHGSPDDRDEYVFSEERMQEVVAAQPMWISACGHTHFQYVFDGEIVEPGPLAAYALRQECRYLFNPGSVGQPRDRDPRAAYAILDLQQNELALVRVEYDIWLTHERMKAAGLPAYLGDRLLRGH